MFIMNIKYSVSLNSGFSSCNTRIVCRNHPLLFTEPWRDWGKGNQCQMCWCLCDCCSVSNKVICLWLRSLVLSLSIHKTSAQSSLLDWNKKKKLKKTPQLFHSFNNEAFKNIFTTNTRVKLSVLRSVCVIHY